MIARRLAVLLSITMVACIGCPGAKMPTSSVDDSTFVRTMVELQRLQGDTTLDSLMRDSTRRIILRRHGLTTSELVQAARAMAYDPARAERVWTAISNARTPGGFKPLRRATTPQAPQHIATPSRP